MKQLIPMPLPTFVQDLDMISDALRCQAEQFTCTEAEAVVRILRAFGLERWAAMFADAHAVGDNKEDDQNDRHRVGHPEDWEHIYAYRDHTA